MSRWPRQVVSLNVAIAILAMAAYSIARLIGHSVSGDSFLGFEYRPGSGDYTLKELILFTAVVEVCLILYSIGWQIKYPQVRSVRVVWIAYGSLCLALSVLFRWLHTQTYGGTFVTADEMLASYVWAAHLAFGLFGPFRRNQWLVAGSGSTKRTFN